MGIWLRKHRFIIRTFLILVLVFFLGFLAAGFIISYKTAGDYVDAQRNYEYEKMRGDADKLNEKLINISTSILQTYQMDGERDSISTLLAGQSTKEDKLKTFLAQSVQSSPYITDIILLDIQKEKGYFQSDLISQKWDSSYDWFHDPFTLEVSKSTSGVLFEESHPMPGIYLSREVCTFGHKIVDPASGNLNAMTGIILIQVPTSELFEPMEGYKGKQEGKTFILDKDNHVLYTNESEISDALAAKIYTQNQQGEESASERYLLRSKKLLSWSGFTYVNVIDKGALFWRNFQSILWNMMPVLLGCIIICFLAINLSVYVIGKRIDRIVEFTRIIQSGNLSEQLSVNRDDEFTSIEQGLNVMTVKLNHYIEEQFIADIALKKAQIQSLQLQMNPHFMFNTLENIRASLVSSGNWESADSISVLGDMYRWNLRMPDIVSLEDELDYLEYYMELQEKRYEGRLLYSPDIPEEFWECSIPKLTLQPVVENCLNHGFTPDMKQCQILLRAWRDEDEKSMCIEVSDNGLGIPEDRIGEIQQMIQNKKEMKDFYHIGMRNIHQRIQLLFGEAYGLHIFSREKEGTRIVIQIPDAAMSGKEG